MVLSTWTANDFLRESSEKSRVDFRPFSYDLNSQFGRFRFSDGRLTIRNLTANLSWALRRLTRLPRAPPSM